MEGSCAERSMWHLPQLTTHLCDHTVIACRFEPFGVVPVWTANESQVSVWPRGEGGVEVRLRGGEGKNGSDDPNRKRGSPEKEVEGEREGSEADEGVRGVWKRGLGRR